MDCEYCAKMHPAFQDLSSARAAAEKYAQAILRRGSLPLFRGEACCYPKSASGTYRVLTSGEFDFAEKTFLIDASETFLEDVEESDDALMYLQHYGFFTDALDFSSSVDVALFFACAYRPEHYGRICVMDRRMAEASAKIIDFRDFSILGHKLRRAEKQQAYAYVHVSGAPADIIAQDSCTRLGAKWFTFQKSHNDVSSLDVDASILDTTDDPCAELTRKWLKRHFDNSWQDAEKSRAMIEIIEGRL